MWFKNLCIYRLPAASRPDPAALAAQLAQRTLQSCGASDAQSIGWVPPRDGGDLVHVVNHQLLLALGAEQKLLPASVVNQFARERAAEIAEAEGRKVGRKEMREIREQMTLELLPRAFVRRRTTFAWIDPVNGWLVVDAAAIGKAEELLELLRKSVDGFAARLLNTGQWPAAAMTGWVASGEAPAGFTLDQDLELRSAEDAKVRYVKHALEGEEIRRHIADGKTATRLAMTWSDRVSFVLTEDLQLKRLAFLDLLKEQNENQSDDADERFDLDFALMAGELARLFDDLLAALGGEQAD
ncbi:MAG: recombination-associated protein RdgC [Proteobacteria bacterium]|nr:recombination-associated protein RdgC [Pseudomonadota bacterium]